MSMRRTVILGSLGWVAVISLLHGAMNLGVFDRASARRERGDAPFRVGFIPVTCHLTCPVTNFINEKMTGDGIFEPIRFNGWPELKETFLANDLEATFILAPMAMSLREQGVPIKIVYLGHRDGTTMMVRKDSTIFRIEDLQGRTIAVPNRFSNQRLIIFKAFKERGMSIDAVTLVEMPPPDMPAALYSRSVDAVISGEPFMAQSEMDGYGRVLFMTKDVWPDFISCVLAVSERVIETRRDDVQRLVDGIARSGKWLDRSMAHRMQAADFSGKQYYHQDPKLLRFVLSKPPDRVKYTNLSLVRKDFEEIERLGIEAGILSGTAHFDDYADPSFVRDESSIRPYDYEAPQ
jgi:NitT/TauT family transport system substrate-binding protein